MQSHQAVQHGANCHISVTSLKSPKPRTLKTRSGYFAVQRIVRDEPLSVWPIDSVQTMNKTYITAALSWGATPTEVVDIRNSNGTRLATFPPDFLDGSALNWHYILHVVTLLLEHAATDACFVDSDGLPVSLDSLPRAGAFTFKQRGMCHSC